VDAGAFVGVWDFRRGWSPNAEWPSGTLGDVADCPGDELVLADLAAGETLDHLGCVIVRRPLPAKVITSARFAVRLRRSASMSRIASATSR
jgi:hypothetical protein